MEGLKEIRLVAEAMQEGDPRIYEITYPSVKRYAVFNDAGLVSIYQSKKEAYLIACQYLR